MTTRSTTIEYIALRFKIERSTDRPFLETIIKRTPEVIGDVMKTKHPQRKKDAMEKRLLDLKARAGNRLKLLLENVVWKASEYPLHDAGVWKADMDNAKLCKCTHRAIFHTGLTGKCTGNFYDDEGSKPCSCEQFEEGTSGNPETVAMSKKNFMPVKPMLVDEEHPAATKSDITYFCTKCNGYHDGTNVRLYNCPSRA
jgi:hypothetical protein